MRTRYTYAALIDKEATRLCSQCAHWRRTASRRVNHICGINAARYGAERCAPIDNRRACRYFDLARQWQGIPNPERLALSGVVR